MFFDPLEIPDDLLVAQEEGRLVIFAGAGVAMGAPSNLPSFIGLATQISKGTPFAEKVGTYSDKLDRFLGDMDRGKVAVQKLCREIIGEPSSKPNELHRTLVDLFINQVDIRIVTTNFDPHFATVLNERAVRTDIYSAPALPLGNDFRGLVFLHGSLARPEPLILTDQNFGCAYLSEGWARQFLQGLFSEFTILFIGYSHTDLPVQYLARGMSVRSIAKRFALAPIGETELWDTLGVKLITFERTLGINKYENLYKGIGAWARFSRQQPTDVADRIKEIACAPEQIKPDRAQSSLLRRCLARDDSCHFFTQHANGWRWVEWLNDQELLGPLFDPRAKELTPPQVKLASWLGPVLLSDTSSKALLLVDKFRGRLGQQLWTTLCQCFAYDDNLSWDTPLARKWLLLLVAKCPPDSLSAFSALYPKVVEKGSRAMSLLMLRQFINLQIVLKKGFDFSGVFPEEGDFQVGEKVEFEIKLTSAHHYVELVWTQYFKPRITELCEELLVLFEDRLREAFHIWLSAGVADSSHDPVCFRGCIYDREIYRTANDLGFIVDLMLDVIEGPSIPSSGLAYGRFCSWILSGVPTLIRLGFYGLHLSKAITHSDKVKFLQNHSLVFSPVFGAKHEIWLILTECYQHLALVDRKALWQTVDSGPANKPIEGETPEEHAGSRQKQIDQLTWYLGKKNAACPLSADALRQLEMRNPGFVGYEGIDQIMFRGSDFRGMAGPMSPKSASELLAQPVNTQMEFLLSFAGGSTPFEETRQALLAAMRSACNSSKDWALSLLQELDKRQKWTSDLWEAALSGMKLPSLAPDELGWVLRTTEDHFTEISSLRGLSDFLFYQVDFSDGKGPSEANLGLMINLSLRMWERVKTATVPQTEKMEETEWLNTAINHDAGRIVDFWMKICGHKVHKSGGQSSGLPDFLKAPFFEIIAADSFAAQLGLAILAERLAFVYFLDPSWVRKNLFRRFDFSIFGDSAFLLWEPFVRYGRFSRDLILEMPDVYRRAFARFRTVRRELCHGFYRHIGVMVYSGLFDVNAGDWFSDFLQGLNDIQRTEWANQMGFVLDGPPPEHQVKIWRRWMSAYWQERLHGRPCYLSKTEAEEMVDWTLEMTPVFAEAVDMLVQGPSIEGGRKFGTVVHQLHQDTVVVEAYPSAVLKLLLWLLNQGSERWAVSSDVENIIFRIPRRKAFLVQLNELCQLLMSLGYAAAANLKQRIEREFREE